MPLRCANPMTRQMPEETSQKFREFSGKLERRIGSIALHTTHPIPGLPHEAHACGEVGDAL